MIVHYMDVLQGRGKGKSVQMTVLLTPIVSAKSRSRPHVVVSIRSKERYMGLRRSF